MAKDAADRHPSAGALAAALDPAGWARTAARIAKGEPGAMPARPGGERRPSPDSDLFEIEGDDEASATSQRDAETRDLGMLPMAWRSRGSLDDSAEDASGRARPWRGRALLGALTLLAMGTWLGRDALGVFVAPAVSGSAISVETIPPGASVWLDGQALGASPVIETPLRAGSHQLRIDRPGFAPVDLRFEPRAAIAFRFALERRGNGAPRPEGATMSVARPGQRIEATASGSARPRDLGMLAARLPRRVAGDQPSYPAAALADQLQGTVVVELTVSESGFPEGIEVVESAGDILDRAMVEGVRTWRFQPAMRGGRPVAVRWQVRQRFEIPQ
jgi:TonB family protein